MKRWRWAGYGNDGNDVCWSYWWDIGLGDSSDKVLGGGITIVEVSIVVGGDIGVSVIVVYFWWW